MAEGLCSLNILLPWRETRPSPQLWSGFKAKLLLAKCEEIGSPSGDKISVHVSDTLASRAIQSQATITIRPCLGNVSSHLICMARLSSRLCANE